MRDGCERCLRLIPLYSRDYWTSGACVAEFDNYWQQHMENDQARFLLPLEVQTCALPDIQPLADASFVPDMAKASRRRISRMA